MDTKTLKKPVVLVVEDRDIFKKSYESIIQPATSELLFAPTAKEALAIIHQRGNSIDLIVVDIDLPDPTLKGMKLINAIRKKNKRVMIIMIAEHQWSAKKQEKYQGIIDEFYFKSEEITKLENIIRQYIRLV